MIRNDFVKRKISLIQDDLAHLADFAKFTFDEVAQDFVKQAAMERMLEKIINRAVDINQHIIAETATKNTPSPKGYKDTFLLLADIGVYDKIFAEEISKSIGTRNKLIHEYDDVDEKVIYDSVGDCLKDYHKYCEDILNFINKVDEDFEEKK